MKRSMSRVCSGVSATGRDKEGRSRRTSLTVAESSAFCSSQTSQASGPINKPLSANSTGEIHRQQPACCRAQRARLTVPLERFLRRDRLEQRLALAKALSGPCRIRFVERFELREREGREGGDEVAFAGLYIKDE